VVGARSSRGRTERHLERGSLTYQVHRRDLRAAVEAPKPKGATGLSSRQRGGRQRASPRSKPWRIRGPHGKETSHKGLKVEQGRWPVYRARGTWSGDASPTSYGRFVDSTGSPWRRRRLRRAVQHPGKPLFAQGGNVGEPQGRKRGATPSPRQGGGSRRGGGKPRGRNMVGSWLSRPEGALVRETGGELREWTPRWCRRRRGSLDNPRRGSSPHGDVVVEPQDRIVSATSARRSGG